MSSSSRPALARRAGSALARLAAHAPRTFGLHLRAGAVAVAELRRRGADLLVRKFSLSPGNSLAMFAGTGLDLADALLKSAEGGLESLAAPDDEPPDLAGLSCRWEPLTAQCGVMLSAIVRANGRTDAERSAILERVLAAFAEIVGERPHGQSPASDAALRFRWPPRGLLREARASSGGRAVAARYAYLLMESLAQGVAQVLRVRIGAFDGGRYRQELRANTDFRKFDGHLRMVLDVTPEQADALAGYLEGEYRGGSLVHGLHRADAALMTCLVFSIEQSEHVHFIDGANGGYAMAARDFKQRAGRGASQG